MLLQCELVAISYILAIQLCMLFQAYPARVERPANTHNITRALAGLEFEKIWDIPIPYIQ